MQCCTMGSVQREHMYQPWVCKTPLQNAYLILGISVWTCAAGVLTQVETTTLE
jgi:hypothetical protein